MQRSRFQTRLLAALGASLAVVLPAGSGQAQTVDAQKLATSKALFDQATAEMNRGQFATACPRLEEVVKLLPDGIGAIMTLAECYEGAGSLLNAWSKYSVALAAATSAGQADRAKRAAAKAAALQARLGKISVVMSEAARALPGVQVTRDGVDLGPLQWDLPVPVDPGDHEIVVRASGRKPWKQRVTVAEGATQAVEVPLPDPGATAVVPKAVPVVPVVPALATTPPPPALAPRAAPLPLLPPSAAEVASSSSWQRPVGVVAAGLGVVGIGVGAVLGATANSKWSQSTKAGDRAYCDASNVCGPTGMALRNTVYDLARGSTAAFIAGSVLVAGGALVFFTAPRSSTRVGVTSSGLLMEGTW